MKKWKRQKAFLLVLAAAFLLPVLAGCSVGSDSFTDPWVADPDFVYEVTYDALGGTINTLPTRVAYYKENSLVKKPSGSLACLLSRSTAIRLFSAGIRRWKIPVLRRILSMCLTSSIAGISTTTA